MIGKREREIILGKMSTFKGERVNFSQCDESTKAVQKKSEKVREQSDSQIVSSFFAILLCRKNYFYIYNNYYIYKV